MIQQLQVLNTLLTMIAISISAVYVLLLQVPPRGPSQVRVTTESLDVNIKRPSVVPEFIFQNDLFATYNPIEPSLRAQKQIQPMPRFQWGAISIPPEVKETEVLPALSVILNGIVLASDPDNSIAIISDETLKERVLYVGDQLKDAFLAKIMKNKIVLFRSNGQQETFFLRKEDEGLLTAEATGEAGAEWKKVIVSLSDGQYQIDPEEFAKKVPSLGSCIEMFRLVPVTTAEGFVGIQCAEAKKFQMLQAFGLQVRDIITGINNIMLTDQKKMLKAYEEIIETKENGTIEFKIQRKNQEVVVKYVVRKIMLDLPVSLSGKILEDVAEGRGSKRTTAAGATQERVVVPQEFNKPDPRRERMHQKSIVEDDESSDYYDTVMKIRKRLIDNMNKRSPHTYVR